MLMSGPLAGSQELARQSRVAAELGSPFVAAVLAAGQRQLWRAPMTEQLIQTWGDDPSAAALAMRFNAALHFLARSKTPEYLGDLYAGWHDDFDDAIGAALAEHDTFICAFMRHTPQTNEVGRAAALLAALKFTAARFGMPFELLEIGSSCGLNLNMARYAYRLGDVPGGDADSAVHVVPEWRGGVVPGAKAVVRSARGVDLNPLDPADPMVRERLMAYIWADQPWRLQRLERALAIARRFPPQVERGDAVEWLSRELSGPQEAGICRVVFHSMVLQYMSADHRAEAIAQIRQAGARATADRPLAWIGFEWTPDRKEVRLSLTTFPDGETRVLALCHAYGNWVDWRG